MNMFAWSIFGGLLHACQIVIHFDALLFYGIMMHWNCDAFFSSEAKLTLSEPNQRCPRDVQLCDNET